MTPEQYAQISQLFHAALDREPAERAAFLAQACVDDQALRCEVESLLAAGEQAGDFIAAPALKDAAEMLAEEPAPSLAGERVGHYQVLSLLGAGGMGEVYRAQDTKLDRPVALKILPPALAVDKERMRRFIREAKAASALNHPNVAHIYEIGEADGTSFIAMECIEGQTLADKLSGRPLEVGEIVEIGLQVADALAEAHSKGITHRDIKPANLMLTAKGQVKVLDFGLAKISRPEGQRADSDLSTLTQTAPGMVLGTLPYMSPEQLLGRVVDHRTDIFSLGATLYEMATGQRAFAATTANQTMDRILHAQPEPVTQSNPALPAELQRIVSKCLAKEREQRYSSARDLITDLNHLKREIELGASAAEKNSPTPRVRFRSYALAALAVLILAAVGISAYLLAGRSGDKAIDSLVVLPFANVGAESDNEYLSDGITESIINSLSQLPGLTVLARSTAFRFKGPNIDPQEVGHKLNVRAVLTGRLQRQGDTLIISAELMDVEKGTQLWGERYNQKVSDVFATQEQISKEISEKLRLKLTGDEQKRLSKRYTTSTEAFDLYLKGHYHASRRTRAESQKATDYFSQAIQLDPTFGLAYAAMSENYAWANELPKARTAALKAVELDETLAEAHNALAWVKLGYDWNFKEAEREFKRAIELNPGYAAAHAGYGSYLSMQGRIDESFAEFRQAQRLDPLSLDASTSAGHTYYNSRQYDLAIAQYKKTLEMDPNFPLAHQWLISAYAQQGNYPEAITELQKVLMLAGHDQQKVAQWITALRKAYAERGERGLWPKWLDLTVKEFGFPEMNVAKLYAKIGDKDRAFESLEKVYREHHRMLFNLKMDPVFDSLRSDPRYADLIRRIGF